MGLADPTAKAPRKENAREQMLMAAKGGTCPHSQGHRDLQRAFSRPSAQEEELEENWEWVATGTGDWGEGKGPAGQAWSFEGGF